MGKLEGKIAIITGGGTGIGKGIARAFAAEDATLIIASRNEGNLKRGAEELRSAGTTVLVAPTDVADEGQVMALFELAMREFGRVDIVVNNAGIEDGGPLEELSLATWQKVLNVNLTGVFLCSREAMKIMKPQGGGRIINIGSTAARVPRMNTAPYAATKHAVVGLTHATALEGRAFGIVASCLHPGNVEIERKGSVHPTGEPQMSVDDIGMTAVAMAALPPNVNMYEALVLPIQMPFLGRG